MNCNYVSVIKVSIYNFASVQGCTIHKRMSYDSHIVLVNAHKRPHSAAVWAAHQKGFRVINLSTPELPDEIWLVLPLKMWINQCYWGLFITEKFFIYTWDFDKVLKWFILLNYCHIQIVFCLLVFRNKNLHFSVCDTQGMVKSPVKWRQWRPADAPRPAEEQQEQETPCAGLGHRGCVLQTCSPWQAAILRF